MTTTTLACHSCGAPYVAGTRFCATCGTDVSSGAGTRAAASDGSTAVLERDEILPILMEATLGEYDIYGLLGRGGMAAVYLALDLALDRKVAIKVMNPQMLMGDDAIARFRREAQTAANLQHPHVIPIYAVKQTPKLVFFVMKYIEGRPLDSIIKELGALPVEMATGILSQVCGALQYAHKRGIVHRDIKPANIMVDEDGQAIVTDFGIAKVQEAKGLTMTGATVGTPAYMSPEQYEGKNITGAADQYSLGVVAYEMLTGRPPFAGDSIMTIMKGHLMEAPPPITAERRDLPSGVATAVMRMLEKSIEDRFPDLSAASAALDARALPDSHPVRTRLIEVAKAGAMQRPRMSVPLSPIPPGKGAWRVDPTLEQTAAARAARGGAAAAPAPGRSSTVGLIAAGLALVAVGGGAAVYLRAGGAAPPAARETATATTPGSEPTTAPGAAEPGGAASIGIPATPPAEPATSPAEPATGAPSTASASPMPAPDANVVARNEDDRRSTGSKDAVARKRPAATKDVRERKQLHDELAAQQRELERLRAQAASAPSAESRVAAPAIVPVAPASAPAPAPTVPAPEATPAHTAASTGTLKIASAVEGELFIQGESKGPIGSAVRTISVKAGMVNWSVRKPGCVPGEGTVEVSPGGVATVGRTKATPTCE